MCGLQIFCFISFIISIYKFYVIFLNFCFVYKFFLQITTPTLIYPFLHQFTSSRCGLQIFCFISHLISIYKFYVIFLRSCFVYKFLQFKTQILTYPFSHQFTSFICGLQIFYFISHIISIYKFYVIFLNFCFVYKLFLQTKE